MSRRYAADLDLYAESDVIIVGAGSAGMCTLDIWYEYVVLLMWCDVYQALVRKEFLFVVRSRDPLVYPSIIVVRYLTRTIRSLPKVHNWV